MLLPASTGSGESDLVSARLAEVLTVVSSVAELFVRSGSKVVEDAEAVLEMSAVSEGSTFTTRTTTAFVPAGTVPSDQETVPAVLVPPLFADTKLVFAGTWSVRLTPRASDGPPLCTVIVWVMLLPASTGS